MSKLSDFICTDNPICGEVEVDVKEVKVSNTEYHGDLWCHMFVTDSAVQSGARDKVDNDVDILRKKWKCDEGCACTQLKVAEFEVEHNQRVHRHH